MTILVVEDEPRMAELIRQGLTEEGHVVTVLHEGKHGLNAAQAGEFDVIILDVMLPGMDGFEITRRLRVARNRTPVLILTARDAKPDIVNGLDIGADDYLTKPFSFEVLLARVRALGRRRPIAQAVFLEAGGLTLHQGTHEVWRGQRRVTLTRTEYAILELLMRNAGRVVPRDSIIESVWGGKADIESNTLDAFVRLLRAKVDEPGQPGTIRTLRGVGYSICPEAD
jgi:DNA-binding response OmpR family regulator